MRQSDQIIGIPGKNLRQGIILPCPWLFFSLSGRYC